MPDLSPTKRSFIELLGIPKRLPPGDPSRALADELVTLYEKREQVVITAVEEMSRLGMHHEQTRGIRSRVEAVQQSIKHAPQDMGPSVLKSASDALQGIYAAILSLLPPPGRAYFARLAAVQLLHAKLKSAVVGREAGIIVAVISKARGEASGGHLGKAIALLEVAGRACEEAEQALIGYRKAVDTAMVVLTAARSRMSPLDVEIATAALQDADTQAELGNREAALTLIAQVGPLCKVAVTARSAEEAVALLRRFDPRGANAGLQQLLAGLAQDLGVARQHATAQDYAGAQSMLERVMQECTVRMQAACIDRLLAMEKDAKRIPTHKSLGHDTTAMNKLLAAARAQAASGRYDSASALLIWVEKKLLALQELWGKIEPIVSAIGKAAHLLDHNLEGALAEALALFNALKGRAIGADFEPALRTIASLSEQAGQAIHSDPVKTKVLLQQMINACGSTAEAAEKAAAFKKRYAQEIQPTHASIEGDPALNPVTLVKLRELLDRAHAAAKAFRFEIASDSLDDALVVMASMLARQPIPT